MCASAHYRELARHRDTVAAQGYKTSMKAGNKTTGARLRIVLKPGIAIGPGKVDLLAGIQETGSIAAAGRRMGMSYKRAWSLVEVMNTYFAEPMVTARRGGNARGGAALTPMGEKVLAGYRRMEALTDKAIAREMVKLGKSLADISNHQ